MRGERRERNHLYSIRSGVINHFRARVADVAIHKEHNLFGRRCFDVIDKVLQLLYEHRTVRPSTVRRHSHRTVRPSTVRPSTVRPSTVRQSTVRPSTVCPSTVRPSTVRRHSHRTRWTTEKQVVVHLLSGEDHEWRDMSPMCVHAA